MACCCGCACDGPPFFDNPANPRFLLQGSRTSPSDISVKILSGPSEIQGTYSLPFIWPSGTAGQAEGIFQGGGYRWNMAQAISGGALSIAVRFGPSFTVCASPACTVLCFVRVFAFRDTFGSQWLFSGNLGDSVASGGTAVACTLPCGNVTQTYSVTHNGFASGVAPSSLSLEVTIPVSFSPLP
jgi:hypothetical protein